MAIQYYADQNIEGKLTVSTVLRVNDSGSSIKGVGINTMNPGGELQIVGGSTGIGNIYLSANAAGSSVTDSLHIKKEGTKASIINRDSGDLSFGANDNNDYVTIKGTGSVGIGTTSPAKKLHVSGGDIRIDDTERIEFGAGGVRINNDAAGRMYLNAPLAYYWQAGSGYKMVLLNSGNVGIGTTSPDSKLNIEGTKNTAILTLGNTTAGSSWVVGDRVGGIDFYSGDGSGGGIGVKASISYEEAVGGTGSSQAMVFRTGGTSAGTNNVERMRLQYNGYVGIGTDSPQEKVHVVEAVPGDTLLEVENTRTNSSAGIKLTSGSNNYIAYTSSAGNFEILNTQTGKVNFVIAANGQGSFGNAVDTATGSAFSVAGGGGILATKYINQRVVWATGFSHTTNNSSAYYYFPVAGYLLTTSNQYYNNFIAPYAGRVKRITIRNVAGTSSAPTATTVNFRVSVNGSVVYTGSTITVTGSTYNKYAMEDISNNDALFVASDIIQVAFRTNGLWRNAAASISLEYTE